MFLRWLDLAIRLVLLTQLATTALMFTGRFSNPDAHKEILGASLGLVAFALFIIRLGLDGEFKKWRSDYLLPLICLGAWCLLRAITSPTPESRHVVTLFLGILVAFPAWLHQMQSPAFRSLFSWGVVALGVLMSWGALLMAIFNLDDLPQFLRLTLTSHYHRQSIGSWLGHNNALAAYLLVAVVHGLGLWWRYRQKGWSLILLGIVILELYLILLSGSRGAWLASGGVALILLYAVFKATGGQLRKLISPRAVAGLGIIAIVLIGFVAIRTLVVSDDLKSETGILSRFVGLKETFAGTYPRVWLCSLLMLKENPIWGVGFNAWQLRYPDMQGYWFTNHPDTNLGLPDPGLHTQRAHSDPLQTAAELGLIGIAIGLWLFFVHGRRIFAFLKSQNEWDVLRLVGLVATTGTLIHSLLYFPFHLAVLSCLFLANLALFAVRTEPSALPKSDIRPPTWLSALATVLCLGFLVFSLYVWFGPFKAAENEQIRMAESAGKAVRVCLMLMVAGCANLGLLALVSPRSTSRQSPIRTMFSTQRFAVCALAGFLLLSLGGAWFGKVASADSRNGRARQYKSVMRNSEWLVQHNLNTAQTISIAADILIKGLKLLPWHAETGHAYSELCYLYALEISPAGDVPQAIAAFQEAIDAQERSMQTYAFYEKNRITAKCHQFLYRIYKDMGTADEARRHFEQAEEQFNKAIYIYPYHFEMLLEQIMLYFEHDETPERSLELAQSAYLQYAAIEPNFAETLYRQGVRDFEKGSLTRSDFLLSTAYTLEPKNEMFVNSLIDFYMVVGHADFALNVAQGFIHDYPDKMDILQKVFRPLIAGGDYESTKVGLLQVIDGLPAELLDQWTTHNPLEQVASIYIESASYAQAEALCDAALEMTESESVRDAIMKYRNRLRPEAN